MTATPQELAVGVAEHITRSLWDRVLEGDPAAMPALMLFLMLVEGAALLLIGVFIVRYFNNRVKDLEKRNKELEEVNDRIRETYQDRLVAFNDRYHETSRTTMATVLTSVQNLQNLVSQLFSVINVRPDSMRREG